MHLIVPALSARRRRTGRALWLAAALTLVAAPALADVYKWVDVQGRIHYSDTPPPPDAKLVSVEPGGGTRSIRPSPPPAPASATPPPPAGVPLPPPSPDEAARLKKTVDADLAGVRATQCKSAQERYQKYLTSRRIYREGANNERVYLSDAEADAERLNARREVDELCGDGGSQQP